MDLNELVRRSYENAEKHGFWEHQARLQANVGVTIPQGYDLMLEVTRLVVNEKLVLIHSELSEALEEVRSGVPLQATRFNEKGKPEGFAIELADAIIRIADLAGGVGINLEHAVEQKMRYNESRPFKHGRTC